MTVAALLIATGILASGLPPPAQICAKTQQLGQRVVSNDPESRIIGRYLLYYTDNKHHPVMPFGVYFETSGSGEYYVAEQHSKLQRVAGSLSMLRTFTKKENDTMAGFGFKPAIGAELVACPEH
jgi:hypothetical protein